MPSRELRPRPQSQTFSFSAETESTTPPPGGSPDGAPHPQPARIGEYRVIERLGQGGMGEVLLAWDETLERQIALKRIRPDRASDADARRRFEIEARITARLQHPSILPVYAYASEGELAYYAMRPVDGRTLAELIHQLRRDGERDASWPVRRTVRLFLQAANAVAYAHSLGVIHRDLKPSNIMIGPFEEVLVLDWGMAKVAVDPVVDDLRPDEVLDPATLARELSAQTASATLVGTPAYMAPEQLALGPASPATDQFALGLILYELLALRPPWRAKTLAELAHAMQVAPPRPTRVQPARDIPHELALVALAAIAHDPAARFPSVSAFAQAVAGALEGRAAWSPDAKSLERASWRIADGRIHAHDDGFDLEARHSDRPFRYFHTRSQQGDVCLEMAFCPRRGAAQLTVHLGTALSSDGQAKGGYRLEVAPGPRRTLSLERAGKAVSGAKSPEYHRGVWYRLVARREQGRVSLEVDGEEIYAYSDPIPLAEGHVGLSGSGSIGVRGLEVRTKGASASVSCLAIPDAFFNRRQFEIAQQEYERIWASLPGRREGRLARYRAGLSLLELAFAERDPELHELFLREAHEHFATWGATHESCLAELGLAMVASVRGDATATGTFLERAFAAYPGDPQGAAVRDWLLGQLHDLDPLADRRRPAALLPIAIEQVGDGWGRRLTSDLVRRVRHDWETPAFLVGRARYRGADPVSRAEAAMFLAFWACRPDQVQRAIAGLAVDELLRPHHVTDGAFCLLELGHADVARRTLDAVRAACQGSRALAVAWRLAMVAVDAAAGAIGPARESFATASTEVGSRPYNTVQLWLARGALAAGSSGVEQIAGDDAFAREHRAWFALAEQDPRRAEAELAPLIASGEHAKGRNLVGLLHAATLAARGQKRDATSTLERMASTKTDTPTPWPRTWTLAAHVLSERLAGDALARYVERAFPHELACLDAQLALWAGAVGCEVDDLYARYFGGPRARPS